MAMYTKNIVATTVAYKAVKGVSFGEVRLNELHKTTYNGKFEGRADLLASIPTIDNYIVTFKVGGNNKSKIRRKLPTIIRSFSCPKCAVLPKTFYVEISERKSSTYSIWRPQSY